MRQANAWAKTLDIGSKPLFVELVQVYKAFESQFGKSMDAEIAKEAR